MNTVIKRKAVKKLILLIVGIIILFMLIVIVNLLVVVKHQSLITKGQPIEAYKEHNKALLVIDIQEATTGDVSPYSYFVMNSDELIENINKIAEKFNSQHIPVIYVRSEISNPLINIVNSTYAKGSLGASFDKRLKLFTDTEIVKNGEDSFRKTDLDSILINHKISELYIVGLDAVECINATIEGALNRKYKVNIIEEAILSKSKAAKDSIVMNFRIRGVGVIPMDSLRLDLLQ